MPQKLALICKRPSTPPPSGYSSFILQPSSFPPMPLPLTFSKQEDDLTPAARTVPLRADVPLADTWDLTALYPDTAAWQTDFDAVRAVYPDAQATIKGKLGESPTLPAHRPGSRKSSQPQDRAPLRLRLPAKQRGRQRRRIPRAHGATRRTSCTLIAEATAFFEPEVQAIDDATFAAFLADDAARPVENPPGKDAPLQAAHPFRTRGTPARSRPRRVGRTPRDLRATHQRGHAVRHDPRRAKPRGRTLPERVLLLPQQA